MHKEVKPNEGGVRRIADNETSSNLISSDISPDVSLATIQATNCDEKETAEFNRIFYILSGTMRLSFNGEESELHAGEACFIGKDTEYQMRGTFEVVTVNQPVLST